MKINTTKPTINYYPNHQGGAVLMVSLILLIALTMLGISALQATKFETRMAASTREYNMAFENAERAIAEANRYCNDDMSNRCSKLLKEFGPTIPVKVDKGKSQFKIMGAGDSQAPEHPNGAAFFLVEGTGISEGGIQVTLHAGEVIEKIKGGDIVYENTNLNAQATTTTTTTTTTN
jgi:hypothetical protein